MNPDHLRKDFPVLAQEMNGNRLVYLDNAATSQKPKAVLDAILRFYTENNSNVHRGVHTLSQRATHEYESARTTIQKHVGAKDSKEILFVRGTTEGINLVASSYGWTNVKEGDEILISTMEHHSNIVPWQMLCERKGAHLKVI